MSTDEPINGDAAEGNRNGNYWTPLVDLETRLMGARFRHGIQRQTNVDIESGREVAVSVCVEV